MSKDLIVINSEVKAEDIYNKESLPKIIEAIENEVRGNSADPKTEKGRKELITLARRVSSSKTFLESKGKELTSEWKAKAKVVDAQIRQVKERMDSLRDETRGPVTEFENIEKLRVSKIKERISRIERMGDKNILIGKDYSELLVIKSDLDAVNLLSGDWAEYRELAIKTSERSKESLAELMNEVKIREDELMELEKLREESRKREIEDREKRIRLEAENRARIEAERKAEREKKEALYKAEREKVEAIEKIRKDAENAARVEREAAESERKEKERIEKIEAERIADEDHRKMVHSELSQEIESIFKNASIYEIENFIQFIDSGSSARLSINY